MKNQEITQKILDILKDKSVKGIIAIQTEEGISVLLRGDEVTMSTLLIAAIGEIDNIGEHNLAQIGTYVLSKALGFANFRNAKAFTEYMLNSARVYEQMQGDKTFS